MPKDGDDLVVPVTSEELVADAVPVETGSVRVTKRVHSHDEAVEQQLRTGRVEVKRVVINRPVDGPLPPRQLGETLVVPVVSEVLRIERQWVLTEEIHVTRVEELTVARETVPVSQEQATVERLDEDGNVIETISQGSAPGSRATGAMLRRAETSGSSGRVLSDVPSLVRKK